MAAAKHKTFEKHAEKECNQKISRISTVEVTPIKGNRDF